MVNDRDENIFKRRGNWREYKKNDKKIDFVYIERFDFVPKKFLYDIEINLENYSNILQGGNKRNIIDLFLKDKNYNKYVLNQIAFDPNNIENKVLDFIKTKHIYIAKPVSGSSGKNISIITNKKKFISKIPEFKKSFFRRDKNIKDKKNWVLQEYFLDPLLYEKKKFHIRAHVIITIDKNYFLSKEFFIIPADKKYKKSDFDNKEIHDTHGGTVFNPKLLAIRDDFQGSLTEENYKKIKKNVIKISKICIKKIKVECYDNVKSCFQIFGLDIMFKKNYEPILIEANITPGIINPSYVLKGVMQEIVDKKYPPKFKPKEEKRFIKL